MSISWGYQALVTAIEGIILFIIFLVLHCLELKFDAKPMSDKEYIQIGMRKYGEDITMAGVPFNYNDQLRDFEAEKSIEVQKTAMHRLIASMQSYNKYGFFSNENLNRFKVQPKMRRAFSSRNMAIIHEVSEENSEDSDEESKGGGLVDSETDSEPHSRPDFQFYAKPRRRRRFSIGTEKNLERYADEKFFSKIDDIRSGKYLPNNVYADSHPPREISESSREYNVDRATQTDDDDLKLLWKLSRMIPPFKLVDILGEFEMDPNGMFIIIRDEGRLKDKHGRYVNSRGYLVDDDGNVIHQNGKILYSFNTLGTKIFNKDELDENGEIPAPFLLEENEFDILAKPSLMSQGESKSSKPPRPTAAKKFKRKDIDRNSK